MTADKTMGGEWRKNAAGVKDGADCYRTINGARWGWWAEDADQFRAAGVRCRRGPDGQGAFIHPEDEEKAFAALSPPLPNKDKSHEG